MGLEFITFCCDTALLRGYDFTIFSLLESRLRKRRAKVYLQNWIHVSILPGLNAEERWGRGIGLCLIYLETP